MQKTLIDPFELASVLLPNARSAAMPPRQSGVQPRQEQTADRRPNWVPRGEAWARVRCWCSED
jgi:hypothetical protein